MPNLTAVPVERMSHKQCVERMNTLSCEIDGLAAKRDLTAEDERHWRNITSEFELVDAHRKDLERSADLARLRSAVNSDDFTGYRGMPGYGNEHSPEIPDHIPGRSTPMNPNGLDLARNESFGAWAKRARVPGADRGEDLSFDKIIRGIATGDWKGAEAEQRAISESPATAGGHMVPVPLAGSVFDRVRNVARVIQAGATVVPMMSQTLKYPRLTSEGTPSWRNENAAISDTAMTFDAVTLTAQSIAIRVNVSWELMEDAPPTSQVIQNSFAQQIALALDLAALRGDGVAPTPRGVLNQTGVTVTAFGGANGAAPTNYDHLLDAVQVLEGANFTPNGVIQSPRSENTLAKLKEATTNAYLQPPPQLSGLARYSTNQIPTDLTVGTSNDCSEVYVADWSHLLIGMRHNLTIQFLQERYADVGQVAFVAHIRADVQLSQPGAFNVITGVRP